MCTLSKVRKAVISDRYQNSKIKQRKKEMQVYNNVSVEYNLTEYFLYYDKVKPHCS